MTKERVIEQYGELRYTIGSGCSGGSLVQQQVANAYPGFYQGITPACSFTDAWSSAMQYVNYQLLRRYFENPTKWAPGVVWTPDEISAVEGHPNPANAVTFTEVIPSSGEPTRSLPGRPAPSRSTTRRRTRRACAARSRTTWSTCSASARRTGSPAGRSATSASSTGARRSLAGKITPAQFVDLNTKIGSFDMDYDPIPERTDADRPALERVYRSGAVNTAENLDQVAIIDLRGPDPGAFHDVYRTYVMRARLEREHGTAANQVLWRGQVAAVRRRRLRRRGDRRDGRVAGERREGHARRPARAQDPRGQAEDADATAARTAPATTSRPRRATRRCSRTRTRRSRAGMPHDRRHHALHAQAAAPRGLRLGHLHRRAVGADAEARSRKGVCDFSKPGEDRVRTNTLADLPGRRRQGRSTAAGRSGPRRRRRRSSAGRSSRCRPAQRCLPRRRLVGPRARRRARRVRSMRVFVNGRLAKPRAGASAGSCCATSGRARCACASSCGRKKGRSIVAKRRYRICRRG